MKKIKVIKVNDLGIEFDNGVVLDSDHYQDCCENHYLSFDDLTIRDFEGLYFDLSNGNFFKGIEDYGVELIPLKGHSIKVPGYGQNNGYYSSNLDLCLTLKGKLLKSYDITDCQEYEPY